jgi:virginiamycin A acetyltransferase
MNIQTESNFCGTDPDDPLAAQFTIIKFTDGSKSTFPHGFFKDWLDRDVMDSHPGDFHIGRNSGVGVGSIVKYDGIAQCLRIGRYVAGGLRLKFLLNGQHEIRTISSYMFSVLGNDLQNLAPPQYGDTVIKNDVWIGDETLFLGGVMVENGCVIGARSVIPPNFRSEPYGIYAGAPAKLIRFRFSEAVRQALSDLAWWELPLEWIQRNNVAFLEDMTTDEKRSLETIERLAENAKSFARS